MLVVMPGRKDYVSVVKANGKCEHRQKRLVLCNLKEVYEQFKTETKVGFLSFVNLGHGNVCWRVRVAHILFVSAPYIKLLN